jgi:hypothetical protein
VIERFKEQAGRAGVSQSLAFMIRGSRVGSAPCCLHAFASLYIRHVYQPPSILE